MSGVIALVEAVHAAGSDLRAEGNRLRVVRGTKLSPDLIERLKNAKSELLKLFSQGLGPNSRSGQTQVATQPILGARLGTGESGAWVKYSAALKDLEARCPAGVDRLRWSQAIEDGNQFFALWGDKAVLLGWTAEDLFGLHEPPPNPHPSYQRLSRGDCTGLVWQLEDRAVVELTSEAATITRSSGATVRYYRINPASAAGCYLPRDLHRPPRPHDLFAASGQ